MVTSTAIMHSAIARSFAVVIAATSVPCQPDGAVTSDPPAPAPPIKIEYPRDADRVIAQVNGDAVTLADLVAHVSTRHDPQFDRFLQTPGGRRCFTADRFGTDWVRQYADVRALEAEAVSRGLALDDANVHLSAALKAEFEQWLPRQNLPADADQKLVDYYLARFQRYHGLRTEVRGWLEFLVPDAASEQELYAYYNAHPRVFGGRLTFAHILIRHRDPVTLELLAEAERRTAWEKIADIQARIAEDGSNFEELAARFSEDRKSAARGGRFEGVQRFHPTLPAVLCRTAWQLNDGAVSAPIDSPYGLHLIKRVGVELRKTFLFTPGAHDTVRGFLVQHRREDLLFDLREKRRVRLHY